MAHQAHNIPWNALASSLEVTKIGPRGTPDRISILTPIRNDAAEKQRHHFVRVFLRTLAAFSTTERRKYPADPLAPGSENPVIYQDSTEPVLRAHLAKADPRDCTFTLDEIPATWDLTRASGWTISPSSYADPRSEVVMVLLATNEMLPLLRLARYRSPEDGARSPLMSYWSSPGPNTGWSNVLRPAMGAYLFFNVMYVREEFWAEAGDKWRHLQRDYRDSRTFRRVIENATSHQDGDTGAIPQREMFGSNLVCGYANCKVRLC